MQLKAGQGIRGWHDAYILLKKKNLKIVRANFESTFMPVLNCIIYILEYMIFMFKSFTLTKASIC